jgi:hypothetical protein
LTDTDFFLTSQSAVIYFFILYSYDTTTARSDGYDIQMYEFSTIMAVGAVLAANFYNGLNTLAWNWWVLGGVLIGPVLIILYTAVYSAFPPTLIWTYVWGNNDLLWPSAYWWLTLLFTILVSLMPRYFYRYITENYYPTDIDILRAIEKRDPNQCVFPFPPFSFSSLFLFFADPLLPFTATGSTTPRCLTPSMVRERNSNVLTRRRNRPRPSSTAIVPLRFRATTVPSFRTPTNSDAFVRIAL